MSIESLRIVIPSALRAHKTPILLSTALVALFSYGLHERGVASRVSRQSVAMASQLKDTRVQIDALTAKLNSSTDAQQPPGRPSPANSAHQQAARRPATKIPKPDPRWRRMQTQLDAQGQAIESTQEELASTRSDLQGSIAKTHEELVVLQKKGERNYFEFDLDKSKNFHSAGPVGVSLRKANTKHQYADLELLVDDRQLSKKHLNLYEPVVFYPSDERQPVELVVISIAKNHIHGYISAPKYKTSELAAFSGNVGDTAGNANGQGTSAPKPRQRLAMGH
jgi:hypothetical protein